MSDDQKDGRSMAGQKSSEGGRSHPEKASPAAIEHYLKGIDYPVNKADLINHARSNDAPSNVMYILGQFEEKQYHSPIDVSKEVGRIE